MSVTLDLRIEEEKWTETVAELSSVCETALAAGHSMTGKSGEVGLLLTDDAEMQQLNRDWRSKDKPTDVLSFPAGEMEAPFLGDIAVGYGIASADAA
ncbi:MAG: rRNA maturation RNase YbeY, partial [Henriciella sp.]|uniref:rRNA maturation RNase YbeY n=1 Tax=Henriciella sp. TaxID=1968823 RepID=UPI003C72A2C3